MQKFMLSSLLALGLTAWASAATSWLWHPATPTFLNDEELFSVTWTGSRFISVGSYGLGMASTNGTQWSMVNLKTTQDLTSVVWTGTQAVAVGWGPDGTYGYGALSLTSPDGLTWTGHPTGSLAHINALAWTGSQIVGVGQGGTILTSSDGVSWTSRTSGTNGQWFAVAVSDTQIVAVGENGAATSRDGVTWNLRTQNSFTDVRAVTWTGTQFLALTASGRAFTSPTGASWSISATVPSTSNYLARVDDRIVSLGEYGSILTSTNATQWSVYNSGLDRITLRGFACSSDSLCVVVGNQIFTTNPKVTVTVTGLAPAPRLQTNTEILLDRFGGFLTIPALRDPKTRVAVYTINGDQQITVKAQAGGVITVPVENLKPGWYLVDVQGSGARFGRMIEIRR